MWEYLEDRPILLLVVLAAVVGGGVAEYVVKRRNGTWVPYRRRPVQGGRGRLVAAAVLVVLVLALGGWKIWAAVEMDHPGGAITGAALVAFALYLSWAASQAGQDVSPEEHRDATWRRPWLAWWVAAQGALVGVAGVGMLAAAFLGDLGAWTFVGGLVALVLSPFLVRTGLRLRVAVPAAT